jgi:hypothetical protein
MTVGNYVAEIEAIIWAGGEPRLVLRTAMSTKARLVRSASG